MIDGLIRCLGSVPDRLPCDLGTIDWSRVKMMTSSGWNF
jgi:hypothetical protein